MLVESGAILEAPFDPGCAQKRTRVLVKRKHNILSAGLQSVKSGKKGVIFAACGKPDQKKMGAPQKRWGHASLQAQIPLLIYWELNSLWAWTAQRSNSRPHGL